MTKAFKWIFFLSFALFSSNIYSKKGQAPLKKSSVNPQSVQKIKDHLKLATFAGGCFWCMEAPFESLEGVYSVVSGYSGGKEKNPTYKEVSSGNTTHIESVQIQYDPKKVQFEKLLKIFWRNIDPTQDNGQFHDIGLQYRTVIFYHDEEQRKTAEQSKIALGKSGVFNKPIVTHILSFNQFFLAEKYHQDYYKKNPIRYKLYRTGSGRDRFLSKTWSHIKNLKIGSCKKEKKKKGTSDVCLPNTEKNSPSQKSYIKDAYDRFKNFVKPKKGQLSSKLSDLQFKVTQRDGTERAFQNKYWDNKQKGLYVDVVSGEPLFSSKDKYDSKTGWPSFTKPIDQRFIKTKSDHSLFFKRTEVRSNFGDSHLGHLFNDGPQPRGLRYCINSAALRFIRYEELEKEGYGLFAQLLD